jgi:hypothetical protein
VRIEADWALFHICNLLKYDRDGYCLHKNFFFLFQFLSSSSQSDDTVEGRKRRTSHVRDVSAIIDYLPLKIICDVERISEMELNTILCCP